MEPFGNPDNLKQLHPFSIFTDAWTELKLSLRWRRLFKEDDYVVGISWWARRRARGGVHVFANIVRFITLILISPFNWMFPQSIRSLISNSFFGSWAIEWAFVPKAFLSDAPGGGKGSYHPGTFRPDWLIKVVYAEDGSSTLDLTPWNEEAERIGYTAISYAYINAKELFAEKYPNFPNDDPKVDNFDPRRYIPKAIGEGRLMTAWRHVYARGLTKQDKQRWVDIALRQRNARTILDAYLLSRPTYEARTSTNENVEYVWLDEFCLFPLEKPDLAIRAEQLGRLADVFRFANQVCVYCPKPGCHHTLEDCDWGSRLWTLSEILHAKKVILWSRNPEDGSFKYLAIPGHRFRAGIQREAALNKHWHLQAIMQHANNSGATSWQHAIHALIVEAILRNERLSHDNRCLAKALNGLLPRRANPRDLQGKDGWADLAWLLELNQGFYNAASLAAVCSLSNSSTQGWLGPPVRPSEGNERLEPVVIAFPIPGGLTIINPKIVSIETELKRDADGMARNSEVRLLRYISLLLPVLGFVVLGFNFMAGAITMLVCFVLSVFLDLICGTMFLQKVGCVALRNEIWETNTMKDKYNTIGKFLGERDRRLRDVRHWGPDQLVSEWSQFGEKMVKTSLIDLKCGVYSEFHLLECEGKPPNALVPLAVHGSGVTCLVLHHHDDPFKQAIKLGIVNMPPFILKEGLPMASLVVGGIPEDTVEDTSPLKRKTPPLKPNELPIHYTSHNGSTVPLNFKPSRPASIGENGYSSEFADSSDTLANSPNTNRYPRQYRSQDNVNNSGFTAGVPHEGQASPRSPTNAVPRRNVGTPPREPIDGLGIQLKSRQAPQNHYSDEVTGTSPAPGRQNNSAAYSGAEFAHNYTSTNQYPQDNFRAQRVPGDLENHGAHPSDHPPSPNTYPRQSMETPPARRPRHDVHYSGDQYPTFNRNPQPVNYGWNHEHNYLPTGDVQTDDYMRTRLPMSEPSTRSKEAQSRSNSPRRLKKKKSDNHSMKIHTYN